MGFFLKGTKEERQQKREEINQKHQEKIDQNNREFEELKAKHEANKIEIQRQYDVKVLEQSLKLRKYGVTLDHVSGLPGVEESAKVKVEADSQDQCLLISYPSSKMQIPYADMIGSELSNDVEVPPDDYETKYMFYIHIHYREAEDEKELVFSNYQENSVHFRDILGLNYILSHLDVKIAEHEQKEQDIAAWNAKFDARDAELKAQREELLNKRAGMIDSLHAMAGGSVAAVAAPAAPAASAADPAAELRRFKSMLEEGLITQEDFDAKKKQLLGL